jgi:antitoxin ParD1/3/4
MPTRNVNLTDHYDQFVDGQVASGRFKNASEVMRAGLRLLEHQTLQEKEKLALLRTLASEAFNELDQDLGTVIDDAEQLKEFLHQVGLRAAGRSNKRTLGD